MSITVERLVKTYGDHMVVNQVSFEVADGECFVLLGPSGSGKSTVLRTVAGLAESEGGRVILHGRDVTRTAPQHRGVGMVFQQYALFGHMNVAENIEFPLRIRKVPLHQRRSRRAELLELVGLTGLDRRYPDQLSGGQQQRVALARALAHEPEVLLLDEPFGALDARIRVELRRTLRRIQRELKMTAIFVTHDQEEAFELADRLGVMNSGRLLEVGPPTELYLRPRTEFVAAFLGKANLMVGECSSGSIRLGDVRFPLTSSPAGIDQTKRVQVLFRPEDVAVKLTREALDWPAFGEGLVEEVDFSGSYERLRLRIPRMDGVRPIAPPVPFGADYLIVEAVRSQHLARRFPLHPGDSAWVGVRHVHPLAHRGLGFLAVDDGTAAARLTLRYVGQLAAVCQARVTLLVTGPSGSNGEGEAGRLRRARELLGDGLAGLEVVPVAEPGTEALGRKAASQLHDLLILPHAERGVANLCRAALRWGEQGVLVAQAARGAPKRVLICVAAGEPAKDGVLFAGRLVRHTGAVVILLTIIPPGAVDAVEAVERFHAAALRTLSLFGIKARSMVREGHVRQSIVEAVREGEHDMLVVGASLPAPGSPSAPGDLVEGLLADIADIPVLIVPPGAMS